MSRTTADISGSSCNCMAMRACRLGNMLGVFCTNTSGVSRCAVIRRTVTTAVPIVSMRSCGSGRSCDFMRMAREFIDSQEMRLKQ